MQQDAISNPAPKKQQWRSLLLALLVTVGLLVALVYAIDWDEVLRHLQQVALLPLVVGIFLAGVQFAFRAQRWGALLVDSTAPATWYVRFAAISIGSLANYVLPFRAGELVKAGYLSRYSTHTTAGAMMAVVLERVFDLAAVLILFALCVPLFPDLPVTFHVAALSLSVSGTGLLVVCIIAAIAPIKILQLFELSKLLIPDFLYQKIRPLAEDFIKGAAVLCSVRKLSYIIMWTIVVWALTVYTHVVLLWSVLPHSSWPLALAVTVTTALAVAAPSLPGFIGVYQWGCIAAFMLLGLSKELGATFSIVVHASQYVALSLLGGGCLLWDLYRNRSRMRSPLVAEADKLQ